MALYSNIALKATQGNAPFKYLGVIEDGSKNQGYLEYSTNEVLTRNAKFAVEFAHDDLVHIRSCLTNKYWARSSSKGNWIVAQGVEPVVDQTSWMCTLFRMDIDKDNEAKFYHVQSGGIICIPNDGSARKMFLSIDPSLKTEAVSSVVDYDTLVVLPKFVAFKGSNGLYYGSYMQDIFSSLYPTFLGSDIGDPSIVNEIQNTSDGHIRVRFVKDGKFWTCIGSGSIVSYVTNVPPEPMQIFDVIKIDNNVVALRSHLNNKFCMRGDSQLESLPIIINNRLIAEADGVIKDTYLEVVEPMFRRTVTTYEFDLDRARIYNKSLLYSDEHTWDNHTNETQTGSANGIISTTKSRTYTSTVTVSGSVTTTFVTGIPYIAEGKIQVSVSASYATGWNQTEQETQQVGDTFTVMLKPMKRTIARGVATMATCDVPFSYIQKDYPTSGGPPIITRLSDGVFTGANAYNFYDDVRYEELPPPKGFRHQAPTKIIKRSAL